MTLDNFGNERMYLVDTDQDGNEVLKGYNFYTREDPNQKVVFWSDVSNVFLGYSKDPYNLEMQDKDIAA